MTNDDIDTIKKVHVELPHDLSCIEIAARSLVNNLSVEDARYHLNRIDDKHGLEYWLEEIDKRGHSHD